MNTTSTIRIPKPAPGEFNPYYGRYIDLVPGDDAMPALRTQLDATMKLLAPLDDARALHRYQPGKWSIKQVIGHITDAERVFVYRATRIGRGDTTPLPGFDENTYAEAGNFDARPIADLRDELRAVRAATIALFAGFDAPAIGRIGTANDSPISVRALGWILAGHELHHRGLLRDRYGLGG